MKKIALPLSIIFFAVTIAYILMTTTTLGIDFVKSRLDGYEVKKITNAEVTKTFEDKFGIDYKVKSTNDYKVTKDDQEYIISEYKSPAKATDDHNDLIEYLTSKSKKTDDKSPDFKDMSKIKENMDKLSKDMKKTKDLQSVFAFDNNSNKMVFKLSKSKDKEKYYKVVRLMH